MQTAEKSYSVLSSAAPENPASFSSSLWTHWRRCLKGETLFSNQVQRPLWLTVYSCHSRRLSSRCSCFSPFSSSETNVFICLISIPRRFCRQRRRKWDQKQAVRWLVEAEKRKTAELWDFKHQEKTITKSSHLHRHALQWMWSVCASMLFKFWPKKLYFGLICPLSSRALMKNYSGLTRGSWNPNVLYQILMFLLDQRCQALLHPGPHHLHGHH